jgi:S1-C subfamily serine protease
LRTGDLIVAVEGQAVEDPNGFDYRFGTRPLGGAAQVSLLRGGKAMTVAVPLQAAPDTGRDEVTIQSRSPFMGARVANLTPALVDELRLDPAASGVVLLDVSDGSLAQSYGFQRGDVVVAVNGSRIDNTRDFDRILKTPARLWRITIIRGGQQISAVLSG